MTRLIVEEGGQQRAFKVSKGKLSVGSGESAKLRLKDPDVAELHAELELFPDKAILRTKAGVMPPSQAGRPLGREAQLSHGVPVQIGGATLTVEFEGGVTPVAPVAPIQRSGQRVAQRSSTGAGRSGSSDSEERTSARRNNYRERKKKQGSGLMIGLLLGVPLICFVGWKAIGSLTGVDDSTPEWDPEQRYISAMNYFKAGSLGRAEESLGHIKQAKKPVSAELQARIDALYKLIADDRQEGVVAEHNMNGSKWLDVKLKAYEKNYLSDGPDHPEIRFFVMRLNDFKKEWPTHPEMDWVDRQLARFASRVDLSELPTWEDTDFELRMVAAIGKNRITGKVAARGDADFTEAFKRLDGYLAVAEGTDRENALLLLDDMRKFRDEWVSEKLQQARFHYDKAEAADWDAGQLGDSIKWLSLIVRRSGDETASNDAAKRIVSYHTGKIANVVQYFENYKRLNADKYADLRRNRVMADFFDSVGLRD